MNNTEFIEQFLLIDKLGHFLSINVFVAMNATKANICIGPEGEFWSSRKL